MEAPSIVSRARTAFHSAAAKAERVFTDIKKSDSSTDRDDCHKQLPNFGTSDSRDEGESKCYHEPRDVNRRSEPIKQDWQERLKNIRIGKRGVQKPDKTDNFTMSFAIFDENLYLPHSRDVPQSKGSGASLAEVSNASKIDIIPPAFLIKQLSVGVETTRNLKSMKDLLASSRDSSPVRERASLGFSAMKSLVLREKEDKFASEFGTDEKVMSLISSLQDPEGHFPGRKADSSLEASTNITSLPKDIHGAPPESFIVKLAEAIGSLKTLRKMALFWFRVVEEDNTVSGCGCLRAILLELKETSSRLLPPKPELFGIICELRRLWSEGQYIPGIPPDEIPDLRSCLLYQQLQVINCCTSRKKRHSAATESFDSVLRQANLNVEDSAASECTIPASPVLYARIGTGELVLRLGADKQAETLTMLETGESIYTPIMQEGPLLTEDLIKETEEFVLRTGSVGAGCSQLLSDMQAFKAANPGCILEDFVRWHSPPDWMETDTNTETSESSGDNDPSCVKGQLSTRMQKEGNLWRELWETAKPVPAVRQAPLYDEDLAVDGILNFLEDISPSELFEQLFVSLVGSGFTYAETTLSTNENLCKLFYECKDYIVVTCQGCTWPERVEDICQVYETVEMMIVNPDEVLKITKQPEEAPNGGEPKGRFKKLGLIFGGKDRSSGRTPPKDSKNSEENSTRQSFVSIFSKKPPKPGSAEKPVYAVGSDWTMV